VTPDQVFAAAAASDPAEAAKATAIYDDLVDRQFRRSPEAATALGLDKDALAWTKSMLSDFSLAAQKENAANGHEALVKLRKVDRGKLAGMDAVNYDTVDFVLASGDAFSTGFDYNGAYGGAPYVLSQLTGAYQQVPDFIDSQHVIESKADADAYMARVEGFGRLLDQEVEAAEHDAALGVIPADFTIDKALIQFKAMLASRRTPRRWSPRCPPGQGEGHHRRLRRPGRQALCRKGPPGPRTPGRPARELARQGGA